MKYAIIMVDTITDKLSLAYDSKEKLVLVKTEEEALGYLHGLNINVQLLALMSDPRPQIKQLKENLNAIREGLKGLGDIFSTTNTSPNKVPKLRKDSKSKSKVSKTL